MLIHCPLVVKHEANISFKVRGINLIALMGAAVTNLPGEANSGAKYPCGEAKAQYTIFFFSSGRLDTVTPGLGAHLLLRHQASDRQAHLPQHARTHTCHVNHRLTYWIGGHNWNGSITRIATVHCLMKITALNVETCMQTGYLQHINFTPQHHHCWIFLLLCIGCNLESTGHAMPSHALIAQSPKISLPCCVLLLWKTVTSSSHMR